MWNNKWTWQTACEQSGSPIRRINRSRSHDGDKTHEFGIRPRTGRESRENCRNFTVGPHLQNWRMRTGNFRVSSRVYVSSISRRSCAILEYGFVNILIVLSRAGLFFVRRSNLWCCVICYSGSKLTIFVFCPMPLFSPNRFSFYLFSSGFDKKWVIRVRN